MAITVFLSTWSIICNTKGWNKKMFAEALRITLILKPEGHNWMTLTLCCFLSVWEYSNTQTTWQLHSETEGGQSLIRSSHFIDCVFITVQSVSGESVWVQLWPEAKKKRQKMTKSEQIWGLSLIILAVLLGIRRIYYHEGLLLAVYNVLLWNISTIQFFGGSQTRVSRENLQRWEEHANSTQKQG